MKGRKDERLTEEDRECELEDRNDGNLKDAGGRGGRNKAGKESFEVVAMQERRKDKRLTEEDRENELKDGNDRNEGRFRRTLSVLRRAGKEGGR